MNLHPHERQRRENRIGRSRKSAVGFLTFYARVLYWGAETACIPPSRPSGRPFLMPYQEAIARKRKYFVDLWGAISTVAALLPVFMPEIVEWRTYPWV